MFFSYWIERREKNSLKNQKREKDIDSPYFNIKKVVLGVIKFHLTRKILFKYFLPFILQEKID
jgi:hypothetical protein